MQQACPKCGSMVRPGARFCGHCQTPLSLPSNLPAVVPPAMLAAAALVAADGRQYPLVGPVTRVGRGPQCGLQLSHPSVSTQHADVEERGGRYVVRDLGSRNGTFVNGLRIAAETPLSPGDQLAFGEARLALQVGGGMAPGPGGTQAIQPASPLASPAPLAGPWQPVPAAAPAGLPALRDWGAKPPGLEGKVLFIDGPHKEQRGSLGSTIAAAGCLAIVYAPLAFIPLLMNRDVSVYYLRLEDALTGQQRAAKIRGEPSGMVSQGDVVALWGRNDGGTLQVRSVYNYSTDTFVRVK
jgi:hypothetical protein